MRAETKRLGVFITLVFAGLVAWRPLTVASPGLPPDPIPKGMIAKTDAQNYYNGQYIAYASDWPVRAGPLRPGVDYRDTILIRPKSFPAGVRMLWRWPDKDADTGVYAYVHLAYGYYAGGVPEKPVAPSQLANLKQLTTDFAVDALPTEGDYNVLSETFLTSRPGDFETRTLEVGFITRVSQSGRRFFDGARPLGVWTDPDGRTWRVALQGGYCMFIPEKGELKQGRLHYAAAFRWLVEKGQLTGAEWFNGLSIGVEPIRGSGALNLRRWIIDYR